MQEGQVPIPKKEEFFDMLNSIGALPIEINRFAANSFPVFEICSLDELLSLLRTQPKTVVFYQIDYYNIDDYLIDEDDISIKDFEPDYDIESFIERVKEYNSKLRTEYDFSKPNELRMSFILSDNCIIVCRLKDKWLHRSLFQSGMGLIESPKDIFNALLFPDIEQQNAAEQKRKQRDLQSRRDRMKHLFDFISNDPSFLICTNQKSRQTYVKKFPERNPEQYEEIQQLFSERTVYYDLLDFVEKVWKLKKEGKNQFTEEVEKLLI